MSIQKHFWGTQNASSCYADKMKHINSPSLYMWHALFLVVHLLVGYITSNFLRNKTSRILEQKQGSMCDIACARTYVSECQKTQRTQSKICE
jgi:hypothetical protein